MLVAQIMSVILDLCFAAQLSGFGSQLMAFVFGFGLIVPIRAQIQYPKIAKFRRRAQRGLFDVQFYVTLSLGLNGLRAGLSVFCIRFHERDDDAASGEDAQCFVHV